MRTLKKQIHTFFVNHWLLCVLFSMILIASGLKLHGSSIAYFCEMEEIGCQSPQKDLLLFQPRSIRSDDWLVGNTILLSQRSVQNADPSDLTGLKHYRALFTDAPTYQWFQVFRPQTTSFLLLPNDFAFAFRWWYRLLMIVVSGYVFARVFFRTDQVKSMTIGLCLLFTPFILWWNLGEVIYYPLFLLSLFKWYLDRMQVKSFSSKVAIFTFLCATFLTTSFLLLLYPPFQLPLIYVLLFLFLGLLIASQVRGKKLVATLLLWVAVAVASLGIVGGFASNYREAFLLLTQSSYPGKRVAAGGGYPLWRYMTGPYNSQLLNDHKPMSPYNQSEAAGFLLPFLFVIPLILWQQLQAFRHKTKINLPLLLVIISIGFTVTWMLVGFTPLLAKWSLMNFVPPDRAMIGLGLASFIGTFIFLFSKEKHTDLFSQLLRVFAVILAFSCTLWTGLYVQVHSPAFIQNSGKILIFTTLFTILVGLLAWKKVTLFLFALLTYSLVMTLAIHPLYRGLGPVTDSAFINEAQRLDPTASKRWVVYDSFTLSSLLNANGFHTWTGTYLHPQPSVWLRLDTSEKYKEVWNRYAHVHFTDKPENPDNFVLTNLDSFVVNQNPCTLDNFPLVTDFVVMNETQARNYICLDKLSNTDPGSVSIYSVNTE